MIDNNFFAHESPDGTSAGDRVARWYTESYIGENIAAGYPDAWVATMEGWSRDDVDAFAMESQKRAAHARDSGWFDRSVVPVKDGNGVPKYQIVGKYSQSFDVINVET